MLKGKVVKLEGDLLEKDTAMKAMSFQLNRLEEQCRKFFAENDSVRFAKEEIMSRPTHRAKVGSKATKKLAETIEAEYLGIALQIESSISSWCSKEVAEQHQFSKETKREWTHRGEVVSERGILVHGGQLVSPYPPMALAEQGRFFTPGTISE